ncbi:MAG: radical SAM protein [Sediminibacterium sp.]
MNKYLIKAVQIDVNGLCNAKCWFCPVAYVGNPKEAIKDMSLSDLENILKQLQEGKGIFVDPSLNIVYTANYNEVLLYKNFEGMLDLYRKYNFKINILSNGIALTKSKVDLLVKNIDIINEVLLNIPSGNEQRWSEYTNMNQSLFKKVVANVNYAFKNLNTQFRIMVNGLDDRSITENGGWVDLLENTPKLNLSIEDGSLKAEILELQELFPGVNIFENYHLYDRAGHLEDLKILSQSKAINKYLSNPDLKVIGCNGGIGVRDRTREWIHINPNGDLFICCNDYDFKTIYGNTNKATLEDIWNSKNRLEMINKSYSDLCTRCSAAVWGK